MVVLSARKHNAGHGGCRLASPEHRHADAATRAALLSLPLAREGDRPELVGVAAGVAFGVEADLPGGQHVALNGVDLRDELAVARHRDIARLEQDLEIGHPALLRLIAEVLADDLGELAREVLGEVHVAAAAAAREPGDWQRAEQAS